MAATKTQGTALNDYYDYMNEESIDCELKCSLCTQPFQMPVSATCGHTFGKNCITGRLKCYSCNKLITTLIPNYYIGSANNLTYIPPNGIIKSQKTA